METLTMEEKGKSINEELDELKASILNFQDSVEVQEWWEKISDAMFDELLWMENDQGFKSHIATHLWEDFPTWPYGMVYKWIDKDWKELKTPVPFKNWETVTKPWALKNARTYYNFRAGERAKLLKNKWYTFTQDNLDALVCQSSGTNSSRKKLKQYVLTNWDNKENIRNFLQNFAITAAWDWKKKWGLIKRGKFAANWFMWLKKPYKSYEV